MKDRCGLCGTRAGDRPCPALDRKVCSSCCGAHRGRTVRCPPSCGYGRQAEDRLRERRARELERAWALLYGELSAAGKERMWPQVEFVARALAVLLHRALAPDGEVEAALRHLDRALSPVVLVAGAPPPLGRALAEEGLLVLVREGRLNGAELREAVQVLADWLSAYRSAEDPFRFGRGLLGLFPPPPPRPSSLIVHPAEAG
ncbi:MAG: hypothetical protein N2320_05475 [Candidatus Bipolaricaulota bacterium]|nr:hypothetical protein [Candidatus Bipolaricaulota bacterium]